MCKIGQNEYKVIGFDGYEGERKPFGSLCNPRIEQTYIEEICGLSNLKYIHLKKTRRTHIKFPTRYCNFIRELCYPSQR